MHISDATLSALDARGWTIYGRRACKMLANAAPAGTISDGRRLISVEFDETGRWLTCEDGFATAFDVDGRDYVGRPREFAEEIDARVAAHFKP